MRTEQFFYDVCKYRHNPVTWSAIVANYSAAAFFATRAHATLCDILLPLSLSMIGYTVFPDACGISGIWSYLFGLLPHKTALDYAVYGTLCGVMFLPLNKMSKFTKRHFGFSMFPWSPRFKNIANATHALFALLGFCSSHIY